MIATIRKFRDLQLIDVLALSLAIVGSVSSVAIFLDVFYPTKVILISLLMTVISLTVVIKTSDYQDVNKGSNRSILQSLTIFFIAAVSLLFRWGPYRFEQGGQDQGLYVNMATTLQRWGSVRFPDAFRQSLDSGAQAIYDQTRFSSYSLVDSVNSLMTIEFYPLHPALMALSQSIFGGLGHESLTIISLLGVFSAWHLAVEVDGRWQVAALFTLLIAVNPALTFFAKFPVTESVALTFVLLGMLYFIKYVRASELHRQVLCLVISLLSFNSLFYVRWQFLLYIPFFGIILVGVIMIPSYRSIRKKVMVFSGTVCVLFAVSMVYYMRKQPELYAPMRDSVVDMFPISSLGVVFLGLLAASIMGTVVMIQDRKPELRFSSRTLNILTLQRIAPFVLPVVMLLAIPSVLSLYAGESMYPWGYRVPVDVDSLVIRYHVGYRLALFASPILFAIVLFGGLGKPVRNKATGLLYIFAAICFTGVLMRPTVPYLYYYGRYLVVDILPAMLLLGSVILVNWMTSKHRISRFVGRAIMVTILIYSLLFSSIMLAKHEGDDAGFFSAIAEEVTKNDVILFSNTSQQVMVPLRARYELNIVALDNLQSGPTSDLVIDIFRPIAKKQGGRLLLMTTTGIASTNMNLLGEFKFTDRYFTNTDHFRGDGLLYLESRRRLLLPTRWQSGSVTWKLFEIN